MSLQEIQSNLNCPKNQFNSFGKYKYRSAEDIVEAVKPLLKKYGYALLTPQEIIAIGGRVYVETTAILMDKEMKVIASATAQARESENKKGMDAGQLTGATGSYSKKYALNNLFAIDDTKDADATNTHGKGAPPQKTPAKKTPSKAIVPEKASAEEKISIDQAIFIKDLCDKIKLSQAQLQKMLHWDKLTQPAEKIEELCECDFDLVANFLAQKSM